MWLIWVILLVQVIGLAVYLGMALLPVTWLCEVAAYTCLLYTSDAADETDGV